MSSGRTEQYIPDSFEFFLFFFAPFASFADKYLYVPIAAAHRGHGMERRNPGAATKGNEPDIPAIERSI